MKIGLDRNEIVKVVQKRLDTKAELFYYIEDDVMLEIIDLLIEAIADAIHENNNNILD